MARTKQTARKSSGGKAPRMQLATTSARKFRSFMKSQQNLGTAAIATGTTAAAGAPRRAKGASFINYENTLGEFKFPVGENETEVDFSPRIETGRVKDVSSGVDSQYMTVNFASRYDDGGMIKIGRPAMNLVFVVDISGSMGSRFANDATDSGGWSYGGVPRDETKLGVAIRCLKAILKQLTPEDSVGILLFNHDVHELQPLTSCADLFPEELEKRLDEVHFTGGTNLQKGFAAGMHMLQKKSKNMSRVMFLTDMESGLADEEAVIAMAKSSAMKKRIHTTVVGVGVDLSVGTVEKLSKIKGCKYSSVSTAAEFEENVSSDFGHDVTPIAFDISLTLGNGYTFEKGYGSPEVNGIKPGSKTVKLSSEFPVRATPDRMASGTLLFKLRSPPAGAKLQKPIVLTTSWKGRENKSLKVDVVADPSGDATIGVRKAVAIVGYVDLQSDYVLVDDDIATQGTPDEQLTRHYQWIERLETYRNHLLSELQACHDDSVEKEDGANSNVRQTLEQMISFEKSEVTALEKKLKKSPRKIDAARMAAGKKDDVPDEFRCPITRELMEEPVMLLDGHSYERTAIAQWIQDQGGIVGVVQSPMTNKMLTSLEMTPNHALRKLICDFIAGVAAPQAQCKRGSKTPPANSVSPKTAPTKKAGKAKKSPQTAKVSIKSESGDVLNSKTFCVKSETGSNVASASPRDQRARRRSEVGTEIQTPKRKQSVVKHETVDAHLRKRLRSTAPK